MTQPEAYCICVIVQAYLFYRLWAFFTYKFIDNGGCNSEAFRCFPFTNISSVSILTCLTVWFDGDQIY